MGALVDQCRRAEFAIWMMSIRTLELIIIWWVTPANLYFTPGWNLRLRRVIAAISFTLIGLSQLYNRIRHAKSIPEAIFGVAHCTPNQADFIASLTWSIFLQFFSAFLWSPLSWCSRRLSTPTSSLILKCVKIVLLVPVQLMRAVFWTFAAFLIAALWLAASVGAPLMNAFVVPFALICSVISLWLLLLYIKLDDTYFPPMLRHAMTETKTLIHGSFSMLHLLQVTGNIAASLGFFGCRDRWFRRDALNAGLGHAVRATLPGLIGPISCDETDLTDAIAAMRGLRNVWRNMEEKEAYVDDPATIVYTLSYKHIPTVEDGQMIRLTEARASEILRNVIVLAKRHGYGKLMLWCDGASVAGVRTDKAWVDIGLLPYSIYRTVRLETYFMGDNLTTGRLWLELEKRLSTLTCGMDVVEEYIYESGVNYYIQDATHGKGHKAMGAVLRLASRIAQGDYDGCDVSQEADRTEIATWARKMLLRSGLREMNEALGWSEEPVGVRKGSAVLTRVTTFSLRTSDNDISAEIAKLPNRNRVLAPSKWEILNIDVPRRTEYWLGLLGFTAEEIGRLENEDLECASMRIEERRTGTWELHVVSLQGDYYASMAVFENIGPHGVEERQGIAAKGQRWLVTNSQVEKNSKIEEWSEELFSEMFQIRELECEVLSVEPDEYETSSTKDNPVAWFTYILERIAEWQHQAAAKLRESTSRGASGEIQ